MTDHGNPTMRCRADPATAAIGPFAARLVAALASGLLALRLGTIIALVLQRLAPAAMY